MSIHNITVKTVLLSLLSALAVNGYAQAPNLEWAAALLRPSGFDITIPESVTTDPSGNIFTTGTFNGTTDFDPGAGVFTLTTAGSSDIFISKLDVNGNFVWAIQIGGVSFESGDEITTDASGNIYVTGSFAGSVDFDPGASATILTGPAGFVAKFDTDANLIWAANIGNGSVSGRSLVVDPFDNICITGTFSGTADFDPGATVSNLTSFGSSDIFVLKLSSAGGFVWVRKMGGTLSDIPNSIDSDASGNLVTTGTFMGTADFDPAVGTLNLTSAGSNDIFISKLDASGNLVWAKRTGSASAFEAGYGITTDDGDNVIATGQFSGVVDFDPGALVTNLTSAGDRDIFILKLDPGGNFMWAKNLGGLNTDVGNAITTDPGGNIYTTGYFEQTADFDPGAATFNLTTLAEWEPFISKLDASGNFVWAISTQSSAGFFESEANSISLDLFDNIIIAGWFEGPMDFDPSSCTEILTSNSDEGFVIKFSPTSLPSCFPTITNFTPGNGPIGTTVVITGTNFDNIQSNNNVTFNGTTAVVTSSTTTSITASVPTGASSGFINVTVNGFTAVSSNIFVVAALVETMTNAIVQNCDVFFLDPGGFADYGSDENITETFLPVLAFDKVKISFISFFTESCCDRLRVYDGPNSLSPLIATLAGSALPSDITATGPGGELTFVFESDTDVEEYGWQALISCVSGASSINIILQPVDYTACIGETAIFTASATGTTNIIYQWQFSVDGVAPFVDITNGGIYSNTNTSALSVNTVGSLGAGRYRCKINGDGAPTVFTADEGLFLNAIPPTPNSSNVSSCTPLSFVLSASGGANGQYRWYTVATGGTNIVGEVNSTLTTPLLSSTVVYFVAISIGGCESSRTPITATVGGTACSNQAPVIVTSTTTTIIAGIATVDLINIISDSDNNLDLSTLKIILQPSSGALAEIANGILSVNYSGLAFSGQDKLTIEVCDLLGSCTQQELTIDVVGDLVIYTGISPNEDLRNDRWIIQNIESLPDTKDNNVSIYNRWGDMVFEADNYDNNARVFTGKNKNGNEIPTGVYFYKIEFPSGRKTLTGYLSLKR